MLNELCFISINFSIEVQHIRVLKTDVMDCQFYRRPKRCQTNGNFLTAIQFSFKFLNLFFELFIFPFC